MSENSNEIRVTAKTLELALGEAAQKLNLHPDQIEHRVVSQTKGGILSFFGRKVAIVASPKKSQSFRSEARGHNGPSKSSSRYQDGHEPRNLRGHSSSPSDEPEEPREELSQEVIDELCEDLRSFCQGICSRMFLEETQVTADLKEDRLVLNVESSELAQQLVKNAKISESLEHVLRKKPRHLKRELPFRIFVDVNGFRRKRELELIEMAQDLSAKVTENQRPIVLNYKSSYDRKIIHMALDKDEKVYTKSIGSGSNRKLMILPYRNSGDEDMSMSH